MLRTFVQMLGKTMVTAECMKGGVVMLLVDTAGTRYVFDHDQDCCERVAIEDVAGDLRDLVGSPIVEACEASSEGTPAPEHAESYTWTFYRFSTVKGTVTVRWLGESNGYYSESVDFTVRQPNPVA